MALTRENYKKGFLVDEEWMGGVSELCSDSNGQLNYSAYVVNTVEGSLIGEHIYSSLDEALRALNKIQRNWAYEAISSCGGGGGKCSRCQGSERASCPATRCGYESNPGKSNNVEASV